MVLRRRRRRMVVGGAVVVGSTEAMVKMSEADAQKVQQATGTPPEDMSHEELQQAMQQQNILPQPVTQEDQQAMASAEDAGPQWGAESSWTVNPDLTVRNVVAPLLLTSHLTRRVAAFRMN